MARIISTEVFTSDTPEARALLADANTREWLYNGADCIITRHVYDAVAPLVDRPGHAVPYQFVRAMQAPAMDMQLRGICVNPLERRTAQELYAAKAVQYQAMLDRLATAVWGQGLNPNSNKQLVAFFYTALGLPVQYAIRKTPEGKIRTPTCDHGALEKLAKMETKGPRFKGSRTEESIHLAAPFVSLILSIRDAIKKGGVLASMGTRFYCAYAVAGPVTARWASFANAFGEGTNLQNITPEMRRPCCADDGWILVSPDLEQAESRFVAALAWQATGRDTYWKACESGDLHTVVCTMSWKQEFAAFGSFDATTGVFNGDLKAAKGVAVTRWYRHLTFRDGAKRIGHGSNYWGTDRGIALMIGSIEASVVANFQRAYFTAFPEIRGWHNATIRMVQTTNALWTPLGRKRIFFGRVQDDSTLREAIAHVPQSSIGELLNLMLYRVWRYGVDGGTITTPNGQVFPFRSVCQLLLQVHDSITVQVRNRPDIVAAVVAKMTELMDIPVPITRAGTDNSPPETRHLRIPLEFQTGFNWAKLDKKRETFSDGNPDGLTEYDPARGDLRRRVTPAKPNAADWLR